MNGAEPAVKVVGQEEHARRRYHNTSDGAFLLAVSGIIRAHLADTGFGTSDAAMQMSMSRMHLHRKLRALTGCSTRQYITSRRLEQARALLHGSQVKVREVAGAVGFRSASYFARAFQRAYGVYPSVYARGERDEERRALSAIPNLRPRPGRFPLSPAAGAGPPR